jgi:hypothetical protein
MEREAGDQGGTRFRSRNIRFEALSRRLREELCGNRSSSVRGCRSSIRACAAR